MKPCYFCNITAPVTFDAAAVFNDWATRNKIICPDRSRFDIVREALAWAALDESDKGAHPECALKWAVDLGGFSERYPALHFETRKPVSLLIGVAGGPGAGKTYSALKMAQSIKDKL